MQIFIHRLGPHTHLGALYCRFWFKRRVWKCLVEIFIDNSRLDNHIAVMDERRHYRLGIELLVFGSELIAFQDVEIVALPCEIFLAERKAYLGGADGRTVMIEVDHEASSRFINQ